MRLLFCVCAVLLALAPTAAAKPKLPTYEVGLASRSIAPDADGTWKGEPVYLGGFGIGGGTEFLSGRPATGVLGRGPEVHAIVIGHGKDTVAIADIQVQGWFAAVRDGALGLSDIRRAVAARTKGALPAERVIVQSDHTHGGPDMMGVWGGAPVAYRQYVFNQTVDAIADAYAHRRDGTLWYGVAPGGDLLHNQFDYDAANQLMDSDVRVLQARDRDGDAFATLLNFSAHATVLGSSNTKATGDWVQEANPLLEKRFGGRAMTMVGTLGRTQPNRAGCADPSLKGDAASLCSLDEYAQRVVDRAADAVAAAKPLRGKAVVKAESFLITDPSSSPVLLGALYAGGAIGIPINRAMTPPYMTGNVIGTVTGTARIGKVMISAGPGEMYPQIPLKVRDLVPGLQGYMTAGLAGDQLGYLIAPFEAYPEPVKATFFDHDALNGDTVVECASSQGGNCRNPIDPIGNDNYAFNVSHTMGERVTCSLLRGAGDLFGGAPRSAYDRCALFANDAALPAGFDVDNPVG